MRILATRARFAIPLGMLLALALACNLGAQAPDAAQITATTQGSTAVAQSDVPQVVIKSPADHSETIVNTELQVYVRATDQVGVTRIEMRADGLIVDSSPAPNPNGAPTLESLLAWTPRTTGPHVLQVVAFRGSVEGNAQTLTLTVRGSAAEVTLPAGSPQFLTASPTVDPSCNIRANVDGLNVRTGPGVNYDPISTLALGATAPISGSNSDRSWYQINLSGQIGWVSAAYSATTGVCNNILVVPIPAPPTVPVGAPTFDIPPTFTALPLPPTLVPQPTVRVVILNTLTFTPGPSGPSANDLTATQILATQTALAQPTVPTAPGAIPTATPLPSATPMLPNLIIASVRVNAPVVFDQTKPVTAGTLTITIANVGVAPAAPFRVSVKQPNGTIANASTVAPLAAGTQIDLPITLYLPQAGVIPLQIIADADNVVAETSKNDNVLAYQLTVALATAVPNAPTLTPTLTYTPPPTATLTPTPTNSSTPLPTNVALPNLIIRGVQLSSDPVVLNSATPATNVVVTVLVGNVGNGPVTTPFQVGVTLPDGRQFTGANNAPINPDATVAVGVTVPFSAPGTVHLTATADIGTTVTESSKADNTFARDVLVTGQSSQPTPTPTLTNTPGQNVTLSNLVLNGVKLAEGPTPPFANGATAAEVHVQAVVSNVGNGAAPIFAVAVAVENGGTFVGSSTQPLPPGGVVTVTIPVTIPAASKIRLTVLINPNNAVPDANSGTKNMLLVVSGPTLNAATDTPVPTGEPIKPTIPPTPTPIPPTPTTKPSSTATASPTASPNTSVPNAPNATRTNTATSTAISTNTSVPNAPTATRTNTPTNTNTAVPNAPTATRTNTATNTNTAVPNAPTLTLTNTPTHTAVPSVPPTATHTALPTNTPTFTALPPTATPTHTNTPIPPTATHTNTPIPPTATHTYTPTPVLSAILAIRSVSLAGDVIVIDPKALTPVNVSVLVGNTGNAPSAPFTIVVQANSNPPVSIQNQAPIPPGGQIALTVPVVIAQAGPVHLTVTLNGGSAPAAGAKPPVVAVKDVTAVLKPTPVPPTPIPPTPIPPTPTPTPIVVAVAPTAISVVPTAGTPPDLLKLPAVPALANPAEAALLANIQAINAKAVAAQLPPTGFALVGDTALDSLKTLKPDQLKLDKADETLSEAAKFFAPGFQALPTLPTTAPNASAASLLTPIAADGPCKGRSPLQCALETTKARVVFISVGAADAALNTPAAAYQKSIEDAVQFAISRNAIPVLVTAPGTVNPADDPKLAAYNLIVYNVAKAANVPLFNLYGALRDNPPNPPLIVNGALSTGGAEPGSNFTPEGVKFGVNVANRAALRLLEALKKTTLAP